MKIVGYSVVERAKRRVNPYLDFSLRILEVEILQFKNPYQKDHENYLIKGVIRRL
jgi:hypothetical protein